MSQDYGPQPPASRSRPKRVFLIDGHSYLYRAFHATPYLSNSRGLPTNTTYAFINMIRKLINEEKPDSMVVVFDSKAPSFREAISETYKAQRPPMPDNLSVQIPYVKTAVQAMGLPILEMEGFEADDIIGTLVTALRERDVTVYIVTSDKDMMQFVSDRVFVEDTLKGVTMGVKEVEEKLGLKPSLVTDYLALAGDASDNIPGVPGVGDKTARDLISTFGPIEEIYRRIDEVQKPSVKEKLIQGRDLAFMSKDLATIRLDVPVKTDPESLANRKPDLLRLKRLYRELEFTSLYREIRTGGGEKRTPPEVAPAALKKERVALLARFRGKGSREPLLDAFAAFDGEAACFSEADADLLRIVAEAGDLVTHNLKPLLTFAEEKACSTSTGELAGPAPLGEDHRLPIGSLPDPSRTFDTMLAAYLINPMRKDYTVGALLEEYLDMETATGDPRHVLIEGAQYLFDLRDVFIEIMKEAGLLDLYEHIEMPLVEVLSAMEHYGVKVDREKLLALSQAFDKKLTVLIKDIYALAGGPFNINSPQQLSRILFDTLRLPPQKKTKTGYSTDTEVLEILSGMHPMPKEILEYRTFAKLKNTYIDVLPTLINPSSGRIHASFNQMVVATGRLSSSDPNLQNIPVRGEEGVKIREAFVPEKGYILISSDYSQIELRVLAHISQDPLLIETFRNDEDIHTKVAGAVFKVAPEQVTHNMRRAAKVINFGIIYGMSGYGLSKELGVPPREAQQYIDDYFDKHRGVRAYMDKVLEDARNTGYVTTLAGRIRYIPELMNPDQNVRQLGERAAMNAPIQGTAADIIKIAMVNIFRRIKEKGLFSRLIMQIHDELVLEVKDGEVEVMEELIRYEMENALALSVPLKVSLGKGRNWAEAHE